MKIEQTFLKNQLTIDFY